MSFIDDQIMAEADKRRREMLAQQIPFAFSEDVPGADQMRARQGLLREVLRSRSDLESRNIANLQGKTPRQTITPEYLNQLVQWKQANDARRIDPQSGRWAKFMAGTAPAMTQKTAAPIPDPGAQPALPPMVGAEYGGNVNQALGAMKQRFRQSALDRVFAEGQMLGLSEDDMRRSPGLQDIIRDRIREQKRSKISDKNLRLAAARGVLNPAAADMALAEGKLPDRQKQMLLLQIAAMRAHQPVDPMKQIMAGEIEGMDPEQRRQAILGIIGVQGTPAATAQGAPGGAMATNPGGTAPVLPVPNFPSAGAGSGINILPRVRGAATPEEQELNRRRAQMSGAYGGGYGMGFM